MSIFNQFDVISHENYQIRWNNTN